MIGARTFLAPALAGFVNLACGAEPEGLEVRFRAHALECERPDMQAKLEVSGVEGVCPLTVSADRTVSGVCRGVPGRDVRLFRLVYYAFQGSAEVQLATATASLDLREEKSAVVTIDFPQDSVTTDFDQDGDGKTNIREYCLGSDPLVRD